MASTDKHGVLKGKKLRIPRGLDCYQVTFRLPTELYEESRILAAKTSKTHARFIMDAVNQYVEEARKKL